MRNAFLKALEDYAQSNTLLIVGDLGFKVTDNFRKKYPKQFINVGVAEQNMTGLAAGLALTGKKVFTYSIANFTSIRPLEQIRNDVAYHNLNVTLVCVGGGLAYGSLGFSHHATEDLAIMRALPNLTVLAPGDTMETYELTKQIIEKDLGPVYLRLGRAGEATLHAANNIKGLKIGKALPLIQNRASADIAILSTGGMLEVASQVRTMLLKSDTDAAIYSFHTLKPFDKASVKNIFGRYGYILSLEEHSLIGGLSSAVLDSLVGEPDVRLDRYLPFGLPSTFTSQVGDQKYLRTYYGISPEKILARLIQFIEKREKWKVAI